MQLTVTGAFIHRVIDLAKKDRAASQDLARDWLSRLKKEQIRDYLLTPDVAEALLTDRLHKDPEATLADLEALAQGKAVTARKAAAPARPKAAPKAKRKARARARKAPPKGKKRHRFTPAQNAKAKERILAHLASHPWSNRATLMEVGDIPTDAIYQRIMAELMEAGAIVKQGSRSRTVYARAGTKAEAGGKKAAPAKKVPAPKLRKGGKKETKSAKAAAAS